MAQKKQLTVSQRLAKTLPGRDVLGLAFAIVLICLWGSGCSRLGISFNSLENEVSPSSMTYLTKEPDGDDLEAARNRLENEHPPWGPHEIITGLTYGMPRIYFDYDSDQLSASEQLKLTQIAGMLREAAQAQVLIEGHCDERGSTEYNFALGQRRAERVRNHLMALGIEGKRLHTISYGEEWPLDLSSGPKAFSKNRRVQFLAYWPKSAAGDQKK